MHGLRTIDYVIRSVPGPDPASCPELPRPPYDQPGRGGTAVALAVESMARHMTDEGWQVMQALQHAGWRLEGHRIGDSLTHVPDILQRHPEVLAVLLQDKREWDTRPADFREKEARFTGCEELARRPGLFKLTILKDAHARPLYHRQAAEEIGCHAWVVYYHQRIVKHLAPYVRERDLVRTWHTIDAGQVPSFLPGDERGSFLMSGAVSGAYPLRRRIASGWGVFRGLGGSMMQHPGYHRDGCATPAYLQELGRWKVAICTSSMYGYALRKIIEATACGCRVITDLPTDEVLPGIDGNLIRVRPDIPIPMLRHVIEEAEATYDDVQQWSFARIAAHRYDYRTEGLRLSAAIEDRRRTYAHD